jgi:transcriptional regulator with XRE-family HTH domain
MVMKDRIRQVMESLHMTQQEFAEKTQIGAATLSNIFKDRTRPTLNVVELIENQIPNISTD